MKLLFVVVYFVSVTASGNSNITAVGAGTKNKAAEDAKKAAEQKQAEAAKITQTNTSKNLNTTQNTNSDGALDSNADAKKATKEGKKKNKEGQQQAMQAMMQAMQGMAQAGKEMASPDPGQKAMGAIGMVMNLMQMMMAMKNGKENQEDAAGADALLGAQRTIDGLARGIDEDGLAGGGDVDDPNLDDPVLLNDDQKNAIKQFIADGEGGKIPIPNEEAKKALDAALVEAKELLAADSKIASGGGLGGGSRGLAGGGAPGTDDSSALKGLEDGGGKKGGAAGAGLAGSGGGGGGGFDSSSAGGLNFDFGSSSKKDSAASPVDTSSLNSAVYSNGLDMVDETTRKEFTLFQRATRRYQSDRRAFTMARIEVIRKKGPGLGSAPTPSNRAPAQQPASLTKPIQ